ncbi:MAG: hypothetical protein WCO56_20485 [Verrucomicrobiota bacterium]
MKSVEQLLTEWEEGRLTAEGAHELKQLLRTPEGRAALVDDWLFYEALNGLLREQEELRRQMEALELLEKDFQNNPAHTSNMAS